MNRSSNYNHLDKKPSPAIQMLLGVVLTLLSGFSIMLLWRWYVTPLGLSEIGLVQAMGLDILISFVVTTQINTKSVPFLERWFASTTFTLFSLAGGWVLHFFL